MIGYIGMFAFGVMFGIFVMALLGMNDRRDR